MEKREADQLIKEIVAVLEPVLKRHGLVLTDHHWKYGLDGLRATKFEIKDAKLDIAQRDALLGATGFKFGQTFVSNGTVFTIQGIRPGRDHNWVIANNPKGSGYRFPVETVRLLLQMATTESSRR